MKFFPLAETAPGSGLFELFGAALEASGTSLALSKALKTVPAGLRVAVAPYRAMSGMPAPLPPTALEQGKAYDLLIEQEEDPGVFASEAQILTSQSSDAGAMALALQVFFGRRIALTPHIETVQEAPPTEETTPVTSAVGSAVQSGGSGTASINAVTSGGAVATSGATQSAPSGSTSGTKGA